MSDRAAPQQDAVSATPVLVGEGVSLAFASVALLLIVACFLWLQRHPKTRPCTPPPTEYPPRATPYAGDAGATGVASSLSVPPSAAAVQVTATADSVELLSGQTDAMSQRAFLRVVGVCYLADWMKGPYTIALFYAYGLSVSDIATLFIAGYLASLVFGTIAGAVADVVGRARSCRYFCLLFAISMLTKASSRFWVLALGRAVGGVADSLLATVFEAWFVSAHHARGHAFARDTFATLASYRSFAAVVAGAAAQLLAVPFGPVAPFMAAVPLVGVALVWMRDWEENYGTSTQSGPLIVLVDCAAHLLRDRRLQLLGACEALFEGGMYIWVFTWPSALDRSNRQTPFGLVFAVFMVAMMCGGVLGRRRSLGYWLPRVHCFAVTAALVAVVCFTKKEALLVAFAGTELVVGLYYATHPTLRTEVIGSANRSATMSLFRVPMNAVVFVVLQLHLSPRQNLIALVFLQVASGVCLHVLRRAGCTPP